MKPLVAIDEGLDNLFLIVSVALPLLHYSRAAVAITPLLARRAEGA